MRCPKCSHVFKPTRRGKTTPRQRREIAEAAAQGETQASLAKRYGISQPAVSRIVAAAGRGGKLRAARRKLNRRGGKP